MAAGLLVATVLYAIIATPVLATENPDGVAVIIGNKTYSHPDVPEVSFAHNDADAIKRYVIETLGFRERNVIDLRDATVAEMEGVFGNERSHKGDLWGHVRKGRSDVVVFYSGHGMPGFKDGRSYLLPSNVAAGRVEISGYPLDVLYDNLAKLEARSALVLIDACFSGGSAGGTLVPAGSFAVVPKQEVAVPGGLIVLTAAGPDEIASWDKDAELGLFTAHLLRALNGEADGKGYCDENGEVTLAEVKAYLDEEMTYQAQRRYGREQTATVIGASDMVLATYAPGELDQSMAEADTTPSVSTDPTFDERKLDLAFWESIKDSSNPDAIEAYLTQYPNGSFAALARMRLEELVGQEDASSDQSDAQSVALSGDPPADGDEGHADINGLWKGKLYVYRYEGATGPDFECEIGIDVEGYEFNDRIFGCQRGWIRSISGSVDSDGRILEGTLPIRLTPTPTTCRAAMILAQK